MTEPDREWVTSANLPAFDLATQTCWHPPVHQTRTETPTTNPAGLLVNTRCAWCGTALSTRWLPARAPDLT